MPYKVVILDDVMLIRRALIQTIDWKSFNCEIVGEAEDGATGRDLIIETKPDIIITDIRMPGLNGLDLIESIKDSMPKAKIIIITGHQEFEYAKKAIELGVLEFILKPIRNDVIIKAVRRAIDEIKQHDLIIKQRLEILKQKQSIEKDYNESLEQLRGKVLADIINGITELNDNDAIRTVEFKLNAKDCYIGHLILKNSSYNDKKSHQFGMVMQQLNELKEQFGVDMVTYVSHTVTNICVLIPKTGKPKQAQVKLRSVADELQKRHNKDAHLAFSLIHKHVSEIVDAYSEASQMFDYHFFNSLSSVRQDVEAESNKKNIKIMSWMEDYYEKLDNLQELDQQLLTVMKAISDYSKGNVKIAKGLVMEVWITTLRYYYSTSTFGVELEDTLDVMLKDISNMDSLAKIYTYMEQRINEIKEKIINKQPQYSLLVSNAIQYIHNHFAEPISLDIVADNFNLNSSYLSRLLKKETGRNFVRILTNTRVREAKKLLKDPANRVSDIAERVGYADYDYFYRVFKRTEGISPTEYVKGIKPKI